MTILQVLSAHCADFCNFLHNRLEHAVFAWLDRVDCLHCDPCFGCRVRIILTRAVTDFMTFPDQVQAVCKPRNAAIVVDLLLHACYHKFRATALANADF